MNYDDIMQSITSGLTGEPANDIEYLYEQGDKFKTHELSQEILRGIGRLLYEVLPPEKREELDRAINNDALGIETAIEEAEFQINKKHYDRALEITENVLKKIESDTGEFILFRDDSISEYHCFRNPFEHALYCQLFNPKKTVRMMSQSFDHIYYVQGTLLFEMQRFDEARKTLVKALKINPMHTDAMFELAEIYKIHNEWDDYIEATKHCLKIAYSGETIGRCYRNLGYYYIEMQEYDVATALYYLSIHFDRNPSMAQSQLFYIQQKTGVQAPMPSEDEVDDILAEKDIQYGSDSIVNSLALLLGQQMLEEQNYSMARYFYSILYSMTYNEEIREIIDNLPQEE